jgi:two-component system sensor histidine kinase HydH
MAGVMAHELRNPLTSLKGHAQLLAEMLPLQSIEQAKAELVVSEAGRLERLTKALLAFVRDGSLVRSLVSPDQLIARALAGLPGERVQLALSEAPEALWVDVGLLAGAIANLLQNALQASQPSEAIGVRMYATRASVGIEVQDAGPGVRPGDEERIFEPFFTTRIQGTGLGLAVARRAVEAHDGTLTVESAIGGGATFRITLPRTVPSLASEGQ